MSASSYDEALARLLEHEGGYSNHPSDPGGPTNWCITIFDYRKYVDPRASAAMCARCRSRWRSGSIARNTGTRCAATSCAPASTTASYYGVNSGIGRAAMVLRRLLALPPQPPAVTDEVIAAAGAAPASSRPCDARAGKSAR